MTNGWLNEELCAILGRALETQALCINLTQLPIVFICETGAMYRVSSLDPSHPHRLSIKSYFFRLRAHCYNNIRYTSPTRPPVPSPSPCTARPPADHAKNDDANADPDTSRISTEKEKKKKREIVRGARRNNTGLQIARVSGTGKEKEKKKKEKTKQNTSTNPTTGKKYASSAQRNPDQTMPSTNPFSEGTKGNKRK